MTNIGSGERAERSDEVIRAIWSSRGILAVSIVCVILNVPAMTAGKISLVKQEQDFTVSGLLSLELSGTVSV